MATLDIIILVCFIPAVVQGLRKGFVNQAVGLLTVIAGIWAGFHFSDLACGWLAPYLPNVSPTVMKIIGFVVLYIVIALVLIALGKVIEGMLKLVLLGWLNRLFGLMLALTKAIIILGTVAVLFYSLNDAFHIVSEDVLKDSTLFWPLRDIALKIFPFFKALIFKS